VTYHTFSLALACAVSFLASPPQARAQVCTEHTFLVNNPDPGAGTGNPWWSQEAQGLTHDADNWYITEDC
jgi:hypothetical protein